MQIKNWREPKQYAYLGDKTTGPQWAWEFLRRNCEYQSAWERMKNIPIYHGQATSDDDPMEWYQTYWSAKPGETVKAFIARFMRDGFTSGTVKQPFESLDVVAARKFHLMRDPMYIRGRPVIPDPCNDSPWDLEGFCFADGVVVLIPAGMPPAFDEFLGAFGSAAEWNDKLRKHVRRPIPVNEVVWRANHPHEVAVTVNLAWPIGAQLRLAESGLREYQKEMVKARSKAGKPFCVARRNKLSEKTAVLYLRLLDAEHEGVKLAKSANRIFPQAIITVNEAVIDRARKAMATAKRLSGHDYPLLLLSGR